MEDYKKYRWFFTSSGKLVIGGKSESQNEDLVKKIIKTGEDYLVMHTRLPGSPFCFIIENPENVNKEDLKQTAIFCASFSQQWKKSKNATVDTFLTKDIYKEKRMKTGTFGVRKNKSAHKVFLKLFLTKQQDILRAVPFKTEFSEIQLKPGNIKKQKAVEKIFQILKNKKINKQQIESAIPPGGFEIDSSD